MSSREQDACVRALERELGERVRCDRERLDEYAWDFGRLICRRRERSGCPELLGVLSICARFGIPITTRRSGHSASGGTLSEAGIVLDPKALDDLQLDPERGCGWLHAGATWHQAERP